MDQLRSGLPSHIDGEYRLGSVLVDPFLPTVVLFRPDGTEFGEGIPVRLTTGFFRYEITLPTTEPLGFWTMQWRGTLDGVAVGFDSVFEVVSGSAELGAPSTETIKLGVLSHLDGDYRIDNELTDPTSPTVVISRPDGSLYFIAAPTRLLTGVYRLRFILPDDEAIGIWTMQWRGALDGVAVAFDDVFDVVAPTAEIGAPSSETVKLGVLSHLDGDYRVGNTLTDPPAAILTIRRPDGSPYSVVTPAKIKTGVYRHTFTIGLNEPVGRWTAEWEGTLAGQATTVTDMFEVTADVDPNEGIFAFGTTISGIQAYLPGLLISVDSKPSRAHVEQFLTEIGSEVALRIGSVTTTLAGDPPLLERVLSYAKHVTYLGAVALIQDATNPERSDLGGDTYAGVTWQRYQAALEKLVGIVDKATPGEDPGSGADVLAPEIESAPPVFTSYMPF